MSAKEALTDPREIRKLFTEIRYARWPNRRVDGSEDASGIPASAGMISDTFTLAEHLGYSGEDAMTLLAYRALLVHERLHDAVLQFYNTHPNIRMPLAGSRHET